MACFAQVQVRANLLTGWQEFLHLVRFVLFVCVSLVFRTAQDYVNKSFCLSVFSFSLCSGLYQPVLCQVLVFVCSMQLNWLLLATYTWYVRIPLRLCVRFSFIGLTRLYFLALSSTQTLCLCMRSRIRPCTYAQAAKTFLLVRTFAHVLSCEWTCASFMIKNLKSDKVINMHIYDPLCFFFSPACAPNRRPPQAIVTGDRHCPRLW